MEFGTVKKYLFYLFSMQMNHRNKNLNIKRTVNNGQGYSNIQRFFNSSMTHYLSTSTD